MAVISRCETNCSPTTSEIFEIFQRDSCKNDYLPEQSLDITEKPAPIQDESIVTLDKLIRIPKLNNTQFTDSKIDPTTQIDTDLIGLEEIDIISECMNENSPPACLYTDRIQQQTKKTQLTGDKLILKDEKKSPACDTSKEIPEKGKKTIRFAEGTLDPQPKKVPKQVTPKYPIIYVSNKATNNEK